MQEYINDGLTRTFYCECGHKWLGSDAGDCFCEECGKISEKQLIGNYLGQSRPIFIKEGNEIMFNPVINFDDATNQYEVRIDEINIYGCGDTKENAIDMVVDMVIDVTEDYSGNDNPYFLKLKGCNDREKVKEILGLS